MTPDFLIDTLDNIWYTFSINQEEVSSVRSMEKTKSNNVLDLW